MENTRDVNVADNFYGFFNNYKFYLNPETNELEIKFVCEDCKMIMTREEMLAGGYQMKIIGDNGPLEYHTAQFRCRDCAMAYNGMDSQNVECQCEECQAKLDIFKLRREQSE